VTSLNRLDRLFISTLARHGLTIGARIRERSLDTEGTLHLLEAFADGTLYTRI
jgi:hypothetical protein